MSKEIEEAIEHLELFKEDLKELEANEDFILQDGMKIYTLQSIETVLNYIKELEGGINPSYEETIMELERQLFDSTPNSVIRKELEEAEKKYKKWRTHIGRLRYEGKIELCEKILKEGEN